MGSLAKYFHPDHFDKIGVRYTPDYPSTKSRCINDIYDIENIVLFWDPASRSVCSCGNDECMNLVGLVPSKSVWVYVNGYCPCASYDEDGNTCDILVTNSFRSLLQQGLEPNIRRMMISNTQIKIEALNLIEVPDKDSWLSFLPSDIRNIILNYFIFLHAYSNDGHDY